MMKKYPHHTDKIIAVFTHLYHTIAYNAELRRLYDENESAELRHRSNIITRDVLMFATQDIDGACGSMLRQLHLLDIKTSYLYLLEKPVIYNSRDDVKKDISWTLEAYHEGERVFTVPKEKGAVTPQQLFRHHYLPQDRRWTTVMTVLYSTNVQYGLAMFEIDYKHFSYLEYLTYQLSAAVKIQELIRTQNETLIQLNKINIALHNMSSLDQLTGALNRRGFYNEAEKQFEQITDKLIVVFVDLDGLKMINDNFGHSEGDIAIKAVADCLREVIADIGIVGRVGGDEFVAMMPSIFDNMSEYVRNKCNEVLDQLNERLKRPYKIAFSMGIFECKANEYKNISEIIDKADYLLYVQKRERKKLLNG
ncbi:MAG: GGDEF domain-containing protein [Ruminococcus sp.]|nr:GGDEF domain-containing protein [Ruminococcus sp.]